MASSLTFRKLAELRRRGVDISLYGGKQVNPATVKKDADGLANIDAFWDAFDEEPQESFIHVIKTPIRSRTFSTREASSSSDAEEDQPSPSQTATKPISHVSSTAVNLFPLASDENNRNIDNFPSKAGGLDDELAFQFTRYPSVQSAAPSAPLVQRTPVQKRTPAAEMEFYENNSSKLIDTEEVPSESVDNNVNDDYGDFGDDYPVQATNEEEVQDEVTEESPVVDEQPENSEDESIVAPKKRGRGRPKGKKVVKPSSQPRKFFLEDLDDEGEPQALSKNRNDAPEDDYQEEIAESNAESEPAEEEAEQEAASVSEPKKKKPRSTGLVRKDLDSVIQLDDPSSDAFLDVSRTRRKRFRPLAFWKNERVVYRKDPKLQIPVIQDVIINQTESPMAKKKSTGNKNQTLYRKGYKEKCNILEIPVVDFETKEETVKAIAYTKETKDLQKASNDSDLKVQSNFSEGNFLISGILVFPPDCIKPNRNSGRHTMVFYVISGIFEVTIHESTFIINTGGQFIVPRGNQYQFRNAGAREGRLFYVHCYSASE